MLLATRLLRCWCRSCGCRRMVRMERRSATNSITRIQGDRFRIHKPSEVLEQTLFEKLATLRHKAHFLEDTDEQSFRYARYVCFINYQFMLWQELRNLKDDEEGFSNLLQRCAAYRGTQKLFVQINYDGSPAFQFPSKNFLGLLLSFARVPV